MRSLAELYQELEPTLRDLELQRTQSVREFSQTALISSVVGGS